MSGLIVGRHLEHSGEGIARIDAGRLSVLGACERQLSHVGHPHFAQTPLLDLDGLNVAPHVEQVLVMGFSWGTVSTVSVFCDMKFYS
jgi:hypothetical protein